MKKILIIGATSAIAEATARLWAARGAALFLGEQRAERLETIAADLRVRGAASVDWFAMDACDAAASLSFAGSLIADSEDMACDSCALTLFACLYSCIPNTAAMASSTISTASTISVTFRAVCFSRIA